jgi:hypothetical protein
MGLQKYRFDKVGQPDANGAIPLHTVWMGGEPIAGVRNCPSGVYGKRTVYVTAEADTWFSIPAAIRVKQQRIKGWLGCADGLWQFHPYQNV